MTVDAFRKQMADPRGRKRLGIELSDAEAAAVLADDATLHHWYDWVHADIAVIARRPEPVRKPLSGFAKFMIASPFLLIAAGVVGYLGTQSDRPGESECTDAIAAVMGAEFSNASVTEYLATPGGSIDVRGEYDGGTFACGLSSDPVTVEQALVFLLNGEARTIVL